MYFKRKAYDELKEWKEQYADKYAVLLEGARRVGKSTIAEQFAQKEYKSYILIDFQRHPKKCWRALMIFIIRICFSSLAGDNRYQFIST